MPNIHPFLVHFPVALLTLAAILDLVALVLRRNEMERASWWVLVAGFVGTAAAVVSGIAAEAGVHVHDEASAIMQLHQQSAFGTTALFAALFLWRIGSRTAIPRRHVAVYVVLLVIATVLMWTTAWLGGELVYTFGVGVQPR